MQNRYLNEIITLDSENDIEHHGVLGMKWGIRRYQPYSLIPRKSGKNGKLVGDAKKKAKKSSKTSVSKKASSKKVADVKKSRNQKSVEAKAEIEKRAKTARQRQQELEKVVNSGDAKLVYEHRHELTKRQLDTAIDRINTEAKVSSLVRQQNPTKLDKLKQFAGKVDDANSIVKTGVNAYKTINEIRGLYKDAKKASTSAEKAEISARTLKTIIDNGTTSIDDIRKIQSKLTSDDLATIAKRTTSLNTIDSNDRSMTKLDKTNEKADASAQFMKTIIDSGNTAADIKKLQSKLTTDDLANLSKRLTSLNTVDNNEYNMSKRDQTRKEDAKKYETVTDKKVSEIINNDDSSSKPEAKRGTYDYSREATEKWAKEKGIDLDEFKYNVQTGKMASREEVDRLLREIDEEDARKKKKK